MQCNYVLRQENDIVPWYYLLACYCNRPMRRLSRLRPRCLETFPSRGKIGGPSLGGLHTDNVEMFMRPLLDPANHSPRETPLDALTFHQYAVCENNTAQGLESIFPGTRRQISSLQQVQAVRDKLRPGAELHLTESGIVCNGPKGCSGNRYSYYYKTADFQRIYSGSHGGGWGWVNCESD